MLRKRVLVAVLASFGLLVLSASAHGNSGRTHLFRGLNEPGLTAAQNKHPGSPPDATGAIGRPAYLESVNSRLGLFGTERLQPLGAVDAYAFWNRPFPTVVDPQLAWDDAARRWYAVDVFNPGATGNEVLLAWSKSADPDLSSGWCTMAIPTGTLFDDFPKLGFGRNHILIGTNVSDLGTRGFLFARLWAIGKPAENDTSCTPLPVSSFGSNAAPLRGVDGHVLTTPVPVIPVHPSGNAYMISADCPGVQPTDPREPSCQSRNPHSNQITVFHVYGSRAAPKLKRDGAVRVPRYSEPKPVPQPGTKRKFDPSDTRLTQAVSAPDPTRGGRLGIWTQHAVAGKKGRALVRWYELDPHRLSLLRHGRIANRRNWVFNAAISPNRRGNGAVIDYNVAGRHLLPEIRARSRGPNTRKGKMRHAITLGHSVARTESCVVTRRICEWGDYAAATPDPRHPNVVWGSNQVLMSHKHPGPGPTNWGTRNFAVRTDR